MHLEIVNEETCGSMLSLLLIRPFHKRGTRLSAESIVTVDPAASTAFLSTAKLTLSYY